MVRKLPPLNALKTFEVSARLGSYVLAAAELHVTPGAVSQQIKKLEDYFGRQLFIRRNNQLQLTDVGQLVYASSSEMMDGLAAMTQRLVDGNHRSSLIISALPSFGVRWLNRHLPDFLAANPELRIDLRLEEDPVDFFRTRIDVRISYGEHLYPEFVTIPFVRDHVTVMCTPAMRASRGLAPSGPAGLRDEDLIHVAWRTGFSAYPTWEAWFAMAGHVRQPRRELGHKLDTSSLAIDLARSGSGVALGQYLLAEDDLASGALVAPFGTSMPLQYEYCAVHATANTRNPTVQSFVSWLVARGKAIGMRA